MTWQRQRGSRGPLPGAALLPLLLPTLAGACSKLCAFDAVRTLQCHVHADFVSDLVRTFDTGVWRTILAHAEQCEEASLDDCSPADGCEVASSKCVSSQHWITLQLAKPESQGGAGFASRCGLFGQMLSKGGACMSLGDQLACEGKDENGTAIENSNAAGCAWDEARTVCDISTAGWLELARRDYNHELARVAMRRQRCTATELQGMCQGDCRWVGGNCTLDTAEALGAISGEDCPLRPLLARHRGCEIHDAANCDAQTECIWRHGRCEAHPMTLERDLLGILGIGVGQPVLLEQFQSADAQCSQLSSADACEQPCAPGVRGPTAPSGARARGPGAAGAALCAWALLWLAGGVPWSV